MIDDLKEIKKIYGEQFSHLCRDNFSKILSEPGILFNIINNTFAPTRSLYQDIIDNDLVIEFKNFIYNEYDKIKQTNLEEVKEIIEESRQHIINKFGRKGYATEKVYFEDLDYKKFLEDITALAENKKNLEKNL